jgi:hypothetical protein
LRSRKAELGENKIHWKHQRHRSKLPMLYLDPGLFAFSVRPVWNTAKWDRSMEATLWHRLDLWSLGERNLISEGHA